MSPTDTPRPSRVALVGPTHPAPGGIVHFTDGLDAAFRTRGPTLLIGWKRRFPRRFYPGTLEDESSTVTVSASGEPLLDILDPRTWRHAARRIVAFEPDLLVLQWWHAVHAPVLLPLLRACRRNGIRVVIICHNVEPHETNGFWRLLTRRTLRRADALMVHAEALREDASRLAPHVPQIVGFHPVFSNVAAATGTATDEALSAVRAAAGAVSRPLLLAFGYVRPYKGVEDAIAAMRHVTSDCALLVAGECWDDEKRYRDAVVASGTGDRVTLDFRYVANDELPALFGAAAAIIAPYREATQSGVIALAFAYERPVVATRVGGLAELVLEGETGTLARPRDPRDLAAAIDRLLATKHDWRPPLSAMREHLSWERYVELVTVVPTSGPNGTKTHAVLDRASRQAKAGKIIRILRRERDLTGARLLDVGTGNGTIASELAVAVGPSGSVLSVDRADVRAETVGYAFRLVEDSSLPVEGGSVDIVVSNHVIEHVGDRAAQLMHLREICRVLTPGGLAYIAVPHRWQLIENHYRLPGLGWVRGQFADRYLRLASDHLRYDCRPLGRRELLALMSAAGIPARDATDHLVEATAALDGGLVARLLRAVPGLRHLIRGPLAPTIIAIGQKASGQQASGSWAEVGEQS